MIVCLCKNVSDKTVRECVEAGAHSAAEVGRACGAGTDCGGCVPMVEAIVAGLAPHPSSRLPCQSEPARAPSPPTSEKAA